MILLRFTFERQYLHVKFEWTSHILFCVCACLTRFSASLPILMQKVFLCFIILMFMNFWYVRRFVVESLFLFNRKFILCCFLQETFSFQRKFYTIGEGIRHCNSFARSQLLQILTLSFACLSWTIFQLLVSVLVSLLR